ncbi:MAG: xanthine dehydrogenase family protein molybdopterin-binding subunit [Candidatus Bathyarchaeota archaeon]|nr:xanthine dehydrogenase family protein molybdopterin-binding subunit [Candidatus Bathyarchaeota archaeon]
MEFEVVGKGRPAIDAYAIVTGKKQFYSDVHLSNMLYARVKTSPCSHAKILGINVEKAKKLPGVRAVITAEDLPNKRWGRKVYGAGEKDFHILARDKVTEFGQPVAAVAAETPEAAAEALELIEVEYDPLPAIFDVEEAASTWPPVVVWKIGEDVPDTTYSPRDTFRPNVHNYAKFEKGDVEKGFAEADMIIERKYVVNTMHHAQLETHGAVAAVEPDGTVVVWTGTQGPFEDMMDICDVLNIPQNRVRIINCPAGGAFGGKTALSPVAAIAAALALKTGRPVKLVLTREESMVGCFPRAAFATTARDGVKKDGRIVARHFKTLINGGGHQAFSPALCITTLKAHVEYANKIPNYKLEAFSVYTNLPKKGAFRGFGTPEQEWALEQQMDEIAKAVGMDPLELRLKHIVEPGDKSIVGEDLTESVGAKECLQKVAELLGWGQPIKKERGPWRRGRGIAAGNKYSGGSWGTNAEVRLMPDGTIQVWHSASDMGQGASTVAAMIAAEEFKVPVERVKVFSADTAYTPFSTTTASSRMTLLMGGSVLLACRNAKKKLFEKAANKLGLSPDELETRNGVVYAKTDHGRGLKFSDIVISGQDEVVGRGSYAVPRSDNAHCFLAAGVELEVNVETGEVRLLKVVSAADAVPINPAGAASQLKGGLSQAVGPALMEVTYYDNGRPLNPTLLGQKVPTALDIPPIDNIVTVFVPKPHPDGPYGAKGLGEGVLSALFPAIANAIADAIGVRITETPITPDKILKALGKNGGGHR